MRLWPAWLCLGLVLLGGAAMAAPGPGLAPGGGAAVAASGPVEAPDPKLPQRLWPDESIYFIMIDRFANGDPANDGDTPGAGPYGWHGGDLQGVIDRLDYIVGLGFSAIWITPHVRNTGRDYHGYGAVDFFAVDSHFGSLEKLKELVAAAHAKGLRVIFDIVVNHTGPMNYLLTEKPTWFHPRCEITWGNVKSEQDCWIYNLPDFDQSNQEARDYILSYSRHWIEETGVDGFRLDTVKHVPKEFFTWYSQELQKIKPGFWLLGEAWYESPPLISIYQDAGITAMLDFPVNKVARDVFAQDAPMTRLANVVTQVGSDLTDPWQMGGFLDNHDITRFMSLPRDAAKERLKLGLLFLFTQRSIPIILYGTEVGLSGMEGGTDMDYNRPDFPWGTSENSDLRDLVERLNQVRRSSAALRRGTVAELLSDRWHYAYARSAGASGAVVVLNNHGSEGFTTELDAARTGFADGTRFKEALTGQEATVSGGKLQVTLAPRSGAIYLTGSAGPPPAGMPGGAGPGAAAVGFSNWIWLLVGVGGAGLLALVAYLVRRRTGSRAA